MQISWLPKARASLLITLLRSLFYCHILRDIYPERERVREGVVSVYMNDMLICVSVLTKYFCHVILCMSTNSLLLVLTWKCLLEFLIQVQQAAKHLTLAINNATLNMINRLVLSVLLRLLMKMNRLCIYNAYKDLLILWILYHD